MRRGTVLAGLICTGLAGCATPPVDLTLRPETPPASGATVRLGTEALTWTGGLEEALGAAGFRTVNGAGAKADYLVQASLAERPAGVGAFVPGAEGAAAQWLAESRKARFWQLRRSDYSLTVVLLDTQTGTPAFRASAHQQGPAGEVEAMAPVLTAALAARLRPQ
ncbi:hypothetical protein [Phenylobacterium sp.]|uniref:hypothetical protein n=1 Tax=Phenylobacterium sp. TaxID=1871053 RepID=UPI002731AFE6|nr:hypothetical protein [Phenylobacterium sp.]MDP1616768.1 hypothetical protein [Phenylobacterium sp.]MDP1988286.1 hypothetical protein [Phenylobacterium sp.]